MKQTTDKQAFHSALSEWHAKVASWPAERARLRRCTTVDEAAFGPAFQSLLAGAQPAGFGNPERLLGIAALGPLVRSIDTKNSFATQMAKPRQGDRPPITDLRFRRLIRTTHVADAYPLLRRTIQAMDGQVNLLDLASGLYWWNDDTKKQWAYDYYAALPSQHMKTTS